VIRIGRSSFTLAQGLFNEDRCVASVEATLVMLDKESRTPRPLPPEKITLLERLSLV
jgi:acyl-CoA thioester hydrolase